MNTKLLKKLRTETGASFLLCKQALTHAKDDYEEAIKYIDKHQEKGESNKRVASKGVVVVAKKDNEAILFEVNAETDFITKNPHFNDFIKTITQTLLNSNVINPVDALNVKLEEGKTIKEKLIQLEGITKENLKLRRLYRVNKNSDQVFGTYNHNHGKMASLVVLNGNNENIANQLAMQVIAMNASYLSFASIDIDTLNYEKMMYEKNHQIFDQNAFEDYLKSISLLNQNFMKDPNLTINELLNQNALQLIDFYKFELGQGIDGKLNCRLDIPCDGSKITVTPIN